MRKIIMAVLVITAGRAYAADFTGLQTFKAADIATAAESDMEKIPAAISLPVHIDGTKAETASCVWVSLRLFNTKKDAVEFAGDARKSFERAGIPVVSAGAYNSFESTGFKYKAMVTYTGGYSMLGKYKSPWYKTEAERDAAITEISAKLAREGNFVLDHLSYREGDGTGPMNYVFEIGYIKTRQAASVSTRLLSRSRLNSGAEELSSRWLNSIPGPLKAAVNAAQRKEPENLGYIFGMNTYPAKTSLIKILADITGYNEADINSDVFKLSSGDPAVRAFAKYLRAEAAAESEDTLPESQIIARNIRNVADEAEKAFLGTKQFAQVQLASHNRQEDGDLDYWTLIAQEKDGSFQVLQYTRNPY